ncbi:unnamed protein product [Protopolystoma xenopodis]|uniref:Uncharacterized protein n=1 Tax=Protopolystoma xenopodis TaxID=117903 RepID=A0A3S5B0Q5_9PLAT|nr:unnamed protein product [Protopolystoma xenopodis]
MLASRTKTKTKKEGSTELHHYLCRGEGLVHPPAIYASEREEGRSIPAEAERMHFYRVLILHLCRRCLTRITGGSLGDFSIKITVNTPLSSREFGLLKVNSTIFLIIKVCALVNLTKVVTTASGGPRVPQMNTNCIDTSDTWRRQTSPRNVVTSASRRQPLTATCADQPSGIWAKMAGPSHVLLSK